MNIQTHYATAYIGAHVLLVRAGQVFLIRRFNTGFGDGLYSVPAGHVDSGEQIVDAVVREANEEAGIYIKSDSLSFAHVVHIRRKSDATRLDRMQCFFVCTSWSGEPTNKEPEKCDHTEWFPLDALPENMVEYVRQAIDGYQSGIHFSHIDD